jgi:hypothetical protein
MRSISTEITNIYEIVGELPMEQIVGIPFGQLDREFLSLRFWPRHEASVTAKETDQDKGSEVGASLRMEDRP